MKLVVFDLDDTLAPVGGEIQNDVVLKLNLLSKLVLNNNLAVQREWAEKKAQGEKVRRDN